MTAFGRDKRRAATLNEKRELYLAAGGHCQRCGAQLPTDWHAAHLTAWANGGATRPANLEAWCKPCNLSWGAENAVPAEGVTLRTWQSEALPDILEEIYTTGIATVAAAPGAGKTLFAGMVFRRLAEAGLVERLVVVVPNTALRRQWVDALGHLARVHLDDEPHHGYSELPKTVGCVVTYQSLPHTSRNHAALMADSPTMVVLDEVHHVGEADHSAWGKAVWEMIGQVDGDLHAAAVLNMTGTLFRSKGTQRISTVRYRQSGPNEIAAVADYEVTADKLIPHELRQPYVYTYGSEVRLMDMETSEVVTGDIADLNERQRGAALRGMYSDADHVRGFCTEAVRLVQLQQAALDYEEPFKLLCVTPDIKGAKFYAEMLNKVTGMDFARLVTSDDPKSARMLRSVAREKRPVAIVAVRMVTEGFDCPAVSTIAYATDITAQLSVAQTMARAMRITDTERRMGRQVPAQYLVHDDPALVTAFRKALGAQMHVLNAETHEPDPRQNGAGFNFGPRYQLLDLSEPVLRGADILTHGDGFVPTPELEAVSGQMVAIGIPLTYAPGVAVISRQTTMFPRTVARNAPVSEPATPREMNKVLRALLERMAGWMAVHLDHDDRWQIIAHFQAEANHTADIPAGGRDQADESHLNHARVWMLAKITQHCRTHDEPMPAWLREQEED